MGINYDYFDKIKIASLLATVDERGGQESQTETVRSPNG